MTISVSEEEIGFARGRRVPARRGFVVLAMLSVGVAAAGAVAADRPESARSRPDDLCTRPTGRDLLIADFEGETYGDWKVEGEAFGPGPARGTLPGQMHVDGYCGRGLVNSFFGGDRTTGRLLSPAFRIQRDYIVFLIGGGGYPGRTCMNLLVEGRTVRTATGPNTSPGHSERLEPAFWDARDLKGRTARLEIVDRATGGWGHINVDHIFQTDELPKLPWRLPSQTRTFIADRRYLLLPIRTGARMCSVDVALAGHNVREFDAEIAESADRADFWAFLDLRPFAGKTLTLIVRKATGDGFAAIRTGDSIPGAEAFYDEPLRPQFHFSQMIGWNNDPNGLVYHDGEWHLFFQHNPYGWRWGNMHWGHAVSRDLLHWEQLPIAIYNRRRGDWAFSGSAAVDTPNHTGLGTGSHRALIAAWTSTGRGECLAFSTDRGRTFREYPANPIIRHRGRDPKLIWYEPGRHWVIVVYDESTEAGRALAFYSSPDLKTWTLNSRLPGYFECPELIELPVDGDPAKRKWVVFAADARYAIGRFDGKRFTPDHEGKYRLHHGAYYASQVFNNAPGGRRIQIGWARIDMPGMPFNQTFSFPHELSLRTTEEGVRMFAEPIAEIRRLYTRSTEHADRPLAADRSAVFDAGGELFDIEADFACGDAARVGLDLNGERIVYDVHQRRLDGASLAPRNGHVTIRALVDRPMLEIIGNDGRVYITRKRRVLGPIPQIGVFAEGGSARLVRLTVHRLRSIWNGRPRGKAAEAH